jgi:hypothetical protein
MEDRIVARVVILPEVFNEKTKSMMDLREYYGEWYPFNNKEIDVCLYSESFLDKEKIKKEVTYFHKLPSKEVKLIPKKHCKVVFEFL